MNRRSKLFVLLVLAALLAACGAEPPTPGTSGGAGSPAPAGAQQQPGAQPVTIEVWDFQQSDKNILDAQQQAIAQFEQENPGIKINVTVFPYPEYRDKLLIAVQSGKPPDISTLDQIWMAEFAAAGAIIALDDKIAGSSIKREDFFPGAWDSNVYQGKTWGIPLNNDVWEEMYYNRELFRQAGLNPDQPPATWDELLAACQKLNQPPNQYGIALIGGKGEPVTVSIDSFIFSNGGRVLSEDGSKAVLDSPEAIAALEFYKQLETCAPPGTANRDEAGAVNAFTAGQTAIALLGSWQQDTVKSRAPDMDWGVAMVPTPAGKDFHGALGGWNMAIYSASQHQEQAWKYVEFLTRKEVQKTVNSLIPARLDAGKEFIQELRKSPDVIFNTVNQGFPRPLSPVYPQVSEIQQTMMQEIWAGTDVPSATKKAVEQINKVLSGQ